MEHPELDALLTPLRALRDDVKRKAIMRLSYEGLDKSEAIVSQTSPYCGKPDLFAMERYCYYPCFKCTKVDSLAYTQKIILLTGVGGIMNIPQPCWLSH